MSDVSKNSTKSKAQDEVFCHSCGNAIKSEAVVCVHCGVETSFARNSRETMQNNNTRRQIEPKDKTTSVLLAVFLGFWTWLYTYKTDAWKFWLNLALTVVTFGFWGLVAWIWAIIDVAVKDELYYKNFPNKQ